jgi:hypothetical protein
MLRLSHCQFAAKQSKRYFSWQISRRQVGHEALKVVTDCRGEIPDWVKTGLGEPETELPKYRKVQTSAGQAAYLKRAANRRHQPGIDAEAWEPLFSAASGLMRTVALIDQERTSTIMLNGVSVARRKRLKPASVAT